MEHGGKMEHRVFRKKHARCGSVVVSSGFPSLANVVWPKNIKLVNDHILNTTQKLNFPILEYFDVKIHLRSGLNCCNKKVTEQRRVVI